MTQLKDVEGKQPNGVIRILIAEDSPTIRHHLMSLIQEMPGLMVVGQAKDGEEALEMVARLRPDVVSMDIRMPRMDGFEATRRIMEDHPTPVVIVSSLVENDMELSFQALEAGALAVVEKPPDRSNPNFPEKQRQLLKTLSTMAGVSVVRRGKTGRLEGQKIALKPTSKLLTTHPEVIAIGASAGGPSALSKLLSALPADLPAPIVIVQHIPHEFTAGLARWLDKVTPLNVRMAMSGLILKPGVVNLSPGTAHTRIVRRGQSLVIELDKEKGDHRYQPSIDVLFHSVAEACGSRAVGLVLTGMGNDGASGLLQMFQAGARTFAQDKASSTVFGMPSAAIDLGAVEQVMPLADLPSAILKLF